MGVARMGLVWVVVGIMCGLNMVRGSKVFQAVVEQEFEHDSTAFTEGLAFRDADGAMLESTGLNGKSLIQEMFVDLQKKSVKKGKVVALPDRHFGEGITFFDGKLVSLTWKSGKVHIYNPISLELEETIELDSGMREGWGLTSNSHKNAMVASDGSAVLHLLKRRDNKLEIVDHVTVHDCDREMPFVLGLNELELIPRKVTHASQVPTRLFGSPPGTEEIQRKDNFANKGLSDDLVWANVITTMCVAAINPLTGQVEAWILLDGIYNGWDRFQKVANGIAFRATDETLWLTGKDWTKLFRIKLEEVTDNKKTANINSHCKTAWSLSFNPSKVVGRNPSPCS